ncbi:carbon-nitrogen hydrolase family protein [Sphingomonas sp. NSE70-1]|uniref:Carbon-nitrogen hydrolase family protein n=1 Tax=Sphingomonas caseinilyticus TaxID=2908205 RepID=A0ABT0RXS7_9SPHN|nr:carbon-nitrogen hydrolase family protein [Sphingomonas caseinilyticus]MCL6699638.1 carbon-nitrogen hydrolase family protein [Sphingomonas caseinilyticus]
MTATRIALFQAQSGIDPAANAERLVSAVSDAAAGGAQMLFTPEMSGMLDRDRERALGKAKPEAEDLVLAAVREAAARHGIWVHLGSLALKGEGGKLVNRGFVIDGQGEIRARYDKIHLFDVDLPTGESWRESAMYDAGKSAVIVPGTPVGKLGLTICYDLRFPELFQRLSEAGADVISVPAAFTVPTGKAHWQVLMRARAIEAELFIVAAAQAGRHEDGRETYGHSLVADPWGELILEMDGEPGLAFAELDLTRIADVRSRIPVHQHRRPIAPVAN